MKIYAVRHGQTIFNQLDKVQGWADTPLTEQGKQDGRFAGERLSRVKFDVAIASDTTRAMHTAEFILKGNKYQTPELILTSDWREYFFGSFEGGSNHVMWGSVGQQLGLDTDNPSEIGKQYRMTDIMNTIHQLDESHIGESAADFWQRIDQSLRHLQENYQQHATILLVTHGQLIGNLAQHYGHLETAQRPRNGSISVFELDSEGNFTVDKFNDVTTFF